MKKLIVAMVGVALFGLGFFAGQESTNHENKETLQGEYIVENDKVKIEYWDIENGDFDIIVTPKGEYNVSPEFSLEDTKYYNDSYLVGKTKKQAKQHYDNVNGKYGAEWDFSWGN